MSSRRGSIAGLIVVALLVGAVFWVAHAMVAHDALQNCVDAGRRNCFDAPN